MRKAELDAILGGDSGPIDLHLAALAHQRTLPTLALGACTLRIEEAEPALLDVLTKAAAGEALSETDERLLFRGVHVLGGARRPRAFAPLLDLLRRPADELEALFGDAITETLPRIVAGVFDSHEAELFAAIEDRERDQFVRSALLGAAAFLTWDKRIDRAAMQALLKRFFETKAAPAEDFAWVAWADAIALLGERDLRAHVYAAFREELLTPYLTTIERFDAMLAEAERAPHDVGRFERESLGYIEDVVMALEAFPSDVLGDDYVDPYRFGAPAAPPLNPFRNVGRNAPCPCGSGKKFKKCCLALTA